MIRTLHDVGRFGRRRPHEMALAMASGLNSGNHNRFCIKLRQVHGRPETALLHLLASMHAWACDCSTGHAQSMYVLWSKCIMLHQKRAVKEKVEERAKARVKAEVALRRHRTVHCQRWIFEARSFLPDSSNSVVR
mmetsp:Transcript_151574/g.263293  ORF Transcript_151574/g.263293 Transcript_151574/m.263293 type:complete len:135 (-) Transcript_151574:69-473(-)